MAAGRLRYQWLPGDDVQVSVISQRPAFMSVLKKARRQRYNDVFVIARSAFVLRGSRKFKLLNRSDCHMSRLRRNVTQMSTLNGERLNLDHIPTNSLAVNVSTFNEYSPFTWHLVGTRKMVVWRDSLLTTTFARSDFCLTFIIAPKAFLNRIGRSI